MEILDTDVANNEAEQRFEVRSQGHIAFLSYRRFPDRFVIVHTEVPPALQNKGIAAKLAVAALDFARASRLRVIPLCPYAASFVRRHPEYQDLLAPQDRQTIVAAEPHEENADTQRADVLKLMAFYEVARRANLTGHADLLKSPAFQKAKELYEARAQYLMEAFGNQEAVNDYFKFRLEGALAKEGNDWAGAWTEFAPESLKTFPLPPGTL